MANPRLAIWIAAIATFAQTTYVVADDVRPAIFTASNLSGSPDEFGPGNAVPTSYALPQRSPFDGLMEQPRLFERIDSLSYSPQEVNDYTARLGFGHDAGQGIGFDENFSTFEMFMPFFEQPWESMTFGDARVILNNNVAIGANIGIGHRVYSEEHDRVYGAYVYWDYRDSGRHGWQQMSLGFESLGRVIDYRINGYFPSWLNSTKGLRNQFVGNQMIVNRSDAAMTGFDAEIGLAVLPQIQGMKTRLFAGLYHFTANRSPDVTGWRFRSDTQVSDTLSVDVSVQRDDTFGLTTTVGVAFRYLQPFRPLGPQPPYPTIAAMRHCPSGTRCDAPWERLGAPVERLQNIVVVEQPGTPAINPVTGLPLQFLHVVEGGTGNGSFEDPYGLITDADDDPRAGDSIIYTPFGGTFAGDVDLPAGARLISNAPVTFVDTTDGPKQIPYSGQSPDLTDLPVIDGNVDMANSTEISGFEVNGGIDSAFPTNLTIINNRVNAGPLQSAIRVFLVSNPTGQITISNNMVSSGSLTGIDVTGIDFTGDITNNTIDGQIANGIAIGLLGTMRGTISGNTSTGNLLSGIWIGAPRFEGTVADNTLENNTGGGIHAQGLFGGTIDFIGDITGNSVNIGALEGIMVRAGEFSGNISANAVTASLTDGIGVTATTFEGEISGNTLSANLGAAIAVTAGTFDGAISNTNAAANGLLGLDVVINGAGDSGLAIESNTLLSNNVANPGVFSDVVVRQSGTGLLTLQLNDNFALGATPMGQFNYDLFNDGGLDDSEFLLEFSNNVGSVGSSDDSVTIPMMP